MKIRSILISALLVAAVVFASGCGKSKDNSAATQDNGKTTEVKTSGQSSVSDSKGEYVEIKLPTMQCNTCKKTIEKAVKKVDGVQDINVVVKEKIAKVTYDKSKTDLSKIEGAIVMAGYQANDKPADKEAYENLEDCCKVGGHDK